MQNKKFFKTIIFIVVLCIPLIYSFFYLKSYWDPYGNLTDLKVAIVNLDKGQDDTNQGNELVKELKDKDVLDLCVVDENQAKQGLQDGEYYATITIPSDFTECLNSASEEQKKVATITYTPNQQQNYLASQIINKVVTATQMELQSKVGKEVVSTLSDTLSAVPDSLQDISDGANEIYDGTSSLNSGLQDLNNGVGELNSKYSEFNKGVENAYKGSESLNSGIGQVNNGIDSLSSGTSTLNNALDQINTGVDSVAKNGGDKINQLTQGIDTLNNGAQTLNVGVNSYIDGAKSLSDGIQSYVVSVSTIDKNESAILQSIIDYDTVINSKEVTNPTIRTLAENAKQILNVKNKSNIDAKGQALVQGTQDLSKNSDQLKAGAKAVSDGTSTLKNSTSEMNELIKNIATLKDGLFAVKQGTETLSNGVSTLKNGTNQVLNGSQSLEQGLQTLSSSSGNVKEALNQLDEGSKSAVDGSKRLLDGVKTFKTEINNGLEKSKVELSKLNGLNDFVSEPVVINEEPYGEVDSYGIAFTPLFLSIGLWVGALMCYVVLYYDQKHRFGKFDYTYKNKLAQNLLYIAIGIVEGIVTGLLLKLGLEFNVANMGIYIAECAIVGAIFMTIIQFLIRNFGDIGKFLALIILVLQLAASGGTFPVETIDKGFRFLNPLLPMTYSIKIFKECLVQTSNNFMGKNTLILVLIGLALGTITLIVEIVKHKGNSKKEIENNNEKVTGA